MFAFSGILTCFTIVWNYLWTKNNLKKYSSMVLKDERDINGEIAIITGCNGGIGKQTALELVRRGATVIMTCRNFQKAEEASKEILRFHPQAKLEIEQIDLADFDSVRDFAKRVKAKHPRIDLLINNGGIFNASLTHSKEGYEPHMRTNHMGAFLLTALLVDQMKRPAGSVSSRIIFISSSMQVFANLDLNDLDMKNGASEGIFGFTPYGNSKLANALISRELAWRLRGCAINSYALCPGLVETELTIHVRGLRKIIIDLTSLLAKLNIREGCKTILHCALSKSLESESGKFYRFLREWDPGQKHYSDRFSRILWDECEKVCGIEGFSKTLEKLRL